MAQVVEDFKAFVAKPEGKAALAAAAVFVGWTWWKQRGANSAALAAPVPATSPATDTGTVDNSVLAALLAGHTGADGLHDGGGVATNSFTGASGSSGSGTTTSTSSAASAAASAGAAAAGSGAQFVSVTKWTPNGSPWSSTLDGIATHSGLTLAQLLAFPENARYRANPRLVHVGDIVRVK